MNENQIPIDFPSLRDQAKKLLASARNAETTALTFIGAHAPRLDALKLSTVQLAVARSTGFESWVKLKRAAEDQAFDRLLSIISRKDSIREVATTLKVFPSLATRANKEGATLLHEGASSNSPEIAALLVGSGARVDQNFEGSAHTALSWALTVNSQAYARALISLGQEPDLFCSAGLGDLARVRAFWVDGKLIANPSVTGSSRTSEAGEPLPRPPLDSKGLVSDALYIACRSGQLEVARFLLDQGGDPNFRGYIGGTCLHWAEYSMNTELAALIRERGGAEDLVDYEFLANPRPFAWVVAAGWGLESMMEALIKRSPEDVNCRCGYGTPLNAAAWNGHPEITKMLLAAGADRKATNAHGLTALQVAQHRGFQDLAEILSQP